MNRTIQLVTEKLNGLLPESQQNYKLDDLRSWGFPDFIVKRIRVELERNLAESLRLPQTDWANMQSPNVQEVWKQFIRAIRNEAWLPASYARTVIETAVADVLEMLVEPRKNIPQAIFGADEQLTAEELEERLKVLVVYRHFSRLLPRYMEKKELDVLTKEKCRQIIKKADEKVVARYTPLNWAQMMEPLFRLLNEQIDSSLLRIFFEDKKMPRIARKFDFMEKAVSRAVLIETLSSPDSLNMAGFEEDQSDLFDPSEYEYGENMPVDREALETSGEKASVENTDEETAGQEEGENEAEDSADTEIMEDINSGESGLTGSGQETETQYNNEMEGKNGEEDNEGDGDEDEESSLNTMFSEELEEQGIQLEPEEEEEVEEWPEEWKEFNPELYDFDEEEETGDEREREHEVLAHEEKSGDEEHREEGSEQDLPYELEEEFETGEEDVSEAGIESLEETDENLDISAPEKKETPMWERFMTTDEAEEPAQGEEEIEPENGQDMDGFIEEPIFDLTMEKEPSEEEITELKNVLIDEQKYFVEEIFGGSERAYDEAIEMIAKKKSWREASRYIEKEVFQRNMIDMYSEEAVEFTDRLHNYFMENSDS